MDSFTYPREFVYKNNWLYQKTIKELEFLRDDKIEKGIEDEEVNIYKKVDFKGHASPPP